MANGEIVSCRIQDNGAVAEFRILNWATHTDFVLVDPPEIEVVSEGFSGSSPTTIVRTLRAVKVRTSEITTAGADLVVPIELSACVYNDDKDGGSGTSGTDPLVTATTGWATSLDGVNAYAGQTASLDAINDSELDYPKAMGRWITPPCQRYTAESEWQEDIVAFSLHTDNSHRFGIAMVEFRVIDADDHEESRAAFSPTTVEKAANGFGPAESYPVWRFTMDAGNRGDNEPFAMGGAKRYFRVYPRMGDEQSVFDSETESVATGVRMSEVFLDPEDTHAAAIDAAIKYADSTYLITGTSHSGTFLDRELAVSSAGEYVRIIDDPDLGDPDTLRFNFLTVERLRTLAITTDSSFVPAKGDFMHTFDADPQTDYIGLVLDYDSGSGTVLYQLLTTVEFSNGRSLAFLRRAAVGDDFAPAGTGAAAANPVNVSNATSITTGSGTWLKGLRSGAELNELDTPVEQGNDANDGELATPKKSIKAAFLAAQTGRGTVIAPGEESGCEVRLFPGDYTWGGLPSAMNSDPDVGYWATVTAVASRPAPRIVGGSPPATSALAMRRHRFKSIIIHSNSRDNIFQPNSDGYQCVAWLDECVLTGECPISDGGGFGGGAWGVFLTSCLVTHKGSGSGGLIIRDCAFIDVGGDLLSYSQCVVNVDIDFCNSTGSIQMHADVGQYEPGNYDLVLWFNVFVRRFTHGHVVPHVNATSYYRNSAYVNVFQTVTNGAGPCSLGSGSYSNILFWNCATDSTIGIGHDSAFHSAKNISFRSCFFAAFQHYYPVGAPSPLYTGWFLNNHYLTTGGANISPGTGVTTGSTRSTLFKSLDPDDPAFYAPEANGALHDVVPAAEVVIGTDVYGNDHTDGDKGAIALE